MASNRDNGRSGRRSGYSGRSGSRNHETSRRVRGGAQGRIERSGSTRAPRGREAFDSRASYRDDYAGYDDYADAPRSSSRSSRQNRVHTDIFHSDLAREPISRFGFLAGAFGILGVAAIARLADFQIINAERYQSEANARRLLSQTLYAKRGTIYDRNGNVLVSSVECKNVYVNPQLIEKKQRKKAIRALVEVLGLDEDYVTDLVDADTTFAYVKRQVDEEDADLLAEKGIAGIEFEQTIKRVYPYENLASQVLGIVNVDNVAVSGLELQYDEVLTGTNGSLVRERARDGSFIAGGAYEKVPAQDGMDVVLALDVTIQRAAEDAIAEAVEKVAAKYGSVIVTDPTNGEILAACSYPTYDQNDLANAATADLNLRVVTDVYEPGSVIKPLVVGAALETGTIEATTTFSVPPVVKAGDDDVSDVDQRDYTMTMDPREILRRSSNTGMVLIGEKLGADNFDEHVIKNYGFGQSTGIDFPGESLGIIKDRDEYDGASVAAMSFGQSLAVEPVQMVRAMSSIANKGIMTTPHFLKTRAGEEVDWTDGEERAMSEETAATLADMMRTVVDEGTGELAQIEGYDVSGKTGTAERAGEDGTGYQKNNNMASFCGFVSTEDPRVMCYVTLDGTAAQSYAATPVFKAVMEAALPTLGIERTR